MASVPNEMGSAPNMNPYFPNQIASNINPYFPNKVAYAPNQNRNAPNETTSAPLPNVTGTRYPTASGPLFPMAFDALSITGGDAPYPTVSGPMYPAASDVDYPVASSN